MTEGKKKEIFSLALEMHKCLEKIVFAAVEEENAVADMEPVTKEEKRKYKKMLINANILDTETHAINVALGRIMTELNVTE